MSKNKGDKRPEKEKDDMTHSTVQFNDLCTTCNNPPICDSTRSGRRPVQFCEQFDNYILPKKNGAPAKLIDKGPVQANGKYTGICSNCDIRQDCMHSSKEGGVWHCEEYC